MADPITMAVVGGSIGAMTNKKDPLKGALLGAAGGYGGGALMGAGGLGAGATQVAGSGGALTGAGASTAANTAFMAPAGVNPGTMIGASQAAPVSAMGTNPGIFSNFTSPIPAPSNAVSRDIGFFESTFNPNIQSSSMAPSFMEQVGSGAGQVGQFAQQNPVLTGMALQSAQQMMQRPEVPMAPAAQISRGEIKSGDYYSLLNPQQNTVLRPQPISLLG
jgi:hypothetical protein